MPLLYVSIYSFLTTATTCTRRGSVLSHMLKATSNAIQNINKKKLNQEVQDGTNIAYPPSETFLIQNSSSLLHICDVVNCYQVFWKLACTNYVIKFISIFLLKLSILCYGPCVVFISINDFSIYGVMVFKYANFSF